MLVMLEIGRIQDCTFVIILIVPYSKTSLDRQAKKFWLLPKETEIQCMKFLHNMLFVEGSFQSLSFF